MGIYLGMVVMEERSWHPPSPPCVVVVEADVTSQLASLLGSLGEVRV